VRSSLVHARLRASIEGTDGGAEFCEGHKLDEETETLVSADAIGRMLSPDQVAIVGSSEGSRGAISQH
jgi:hypothetical protein